MRQVISEHKVAADQLYNVRTIQQFLILKMPKGNFDSPSQVAYTLNLRYDTCYRYANHSSLQYNAKRAKM